MARVGTINLNLGTWLDAENPGAGSQTVDNTGLNGDKIKLDTAVGAEHNANGTHKDDKIDGPALKTTVADGSTLQASGTPRKLSVKDEGITGIKLNAGVVDNDSLEVSAATGAKTLRIKQIKAGKILGAGTGKAVDGTTIGLNGSNELEVKDDGVNAAKISHDNNRTKIFLTFSIDSSTKFGVVGNMITTAAIGVPMPRAGCVTGLSVTDAVGNVASDTAAYNVAGANHFAAGSKITVQDDGTGILYVKVNGSSLADPISGTATEVSSLVTVEIELDD